MHVDFMAVCLKTKWILNVKGSELVVYLQKNNKFWNTKEVQWVLKLLCFGDFLKNFSERA